MASIAGIYEKKTKPGRLIFVLTDIKAERKDWMFPEGKRVGYYYKCMLVNPLLPRDWIWYEYTWNDATNRPEIGPLAHPAGHRVGMNKLSKEDQEYITMLATKYIWSKK